MKGGPESLVSGPESDKSVNIEFILDASGSMLERVGGRPKVEIAKEVITRLVGELPPGIRVGLMVYGHRYPESDKVRSCEDIQLLTPLGVGNSRGIAAQLQGIQPHGWTPMARSLEQAGQGMAGQSQSINNIVLLSDGKETCDGKPGEVAQKLKDGPAKLTVHAIGFAIDDDARKELGEMASASGGTYNEAQDAQGLLDAVGRALLAARSGTFLRAEATGEGERRVPLSVWLMDPATGLKLHEFRSWVDSPVAPGLYDILIGSAPRVEYRGVEIKPHTRTTILIGVGAIRVELADAQGQPLKTLVHLKDRGSGAILRDFPTWYNQPALPGAYDLQVDSNPPVVRRNVQVSAKALAVVDMRNGSLRVDALGLGGERPNWPIELRDTQTNDLLYQSLVGRDLAVMAGDYRLIVLSRPTLSMPLKVGPGEVKTLSLQTGLLRVELLDRQGLRLNLSVSLEGGGQGSAGVFSTWEDASILPGGYQLVIPTQPEIRQQVQVSPTQPTILRLRSP
ncbi:MAG: VWA domain-containing protein [Dehalococcoidia bacterium]|nr:VWA domain-containing protein [Dehalococcoidia bacterium]